MERRVAEQGRKRRNLYIAGGAVGTIAALVVLAAATGLFPDASSDPYREVAIADICYPEEPHAYDIHTSLTIRITDDDGQVQEILPPRGFGEEQDCVRVIHTHDTSGELHIHMDRYRKTTLGDFFDIWERDFNSTRVLEWEVDEEHELYVTVDGQRASSYRGTEFQPDRELVIEYRPLDL